MGVGVFLLFYGLNYLALTFIINGGILSILGIFLMFFMVILIPNYIIEVFITLFPGTSVQSAVFDTLTTKGQIAAFTLSIICYFILGVIISWIINKIKSGIINKIKNREQNNGRN